jgi:hypothetical protein
MRKILVSLLIVMPLISYSQDIIMLRTGEQIDCKITKVDSTIIYYDFFKGERKLSSYIAKNNIRSYKILEIDEKNGQHSDDGPIIQDNTVIIDTTKYIRETSKWINLITYSQKYGINAKGWSVQYYGYNLKNTSNWSIPVLFGIEGFEIYSDYFSQFHYQSVAMSYFLIGISPFYRLSDNFFLNLGINMVIGNENLKDFYGKESSNTFFGIAPSQGIYFIPKSKWGITMGLSVYEKALSSKVYKNDLGVKLEIGIKF